MFTKINNDSSWNNGLVSGNRQPRLFVIGPDGGVTLFSGPIPSVLAVTGEDYEKAGKWSNTTYRFACARGVTLMQSLSDLHQRPFAQYATWADVHAAFQSKAARHVDAASLEKALRASYSEAQCARVDEREAALAALDVDDVDDVCSADVILSAFSPNMLCFQGGAPVGVTFTPISVDEACRLADGAPSAVGHEDTARVFSATLGVAVAFNRITATLQRGVVALVGQYRGPRLAEGATTLPDGATIQWLRVEVR